MPYAALDGRGPSSYEQQQQQQRGGNYDGERRPSQSTTTDNTNTSREDFVARDANQCTHKKNNSSSSSSNQGNYLADQQQRHSNLLLKGRFVPASHVAKERRKSADVGETGSIPAGHRHPHPSQAFASGKLQSRSFDFDAATTTSATEVSLMTEKSFKADDTSQIQRVSSDSEVATLDLLTNTSTSPLSTITGDEIVVCNPAFSTSLAASCCTDEPGATQSQQKTPLEEDDVEKMEAAVVGGGRNGKPQGPCSPPSQVVVEVAEPLGSIEDLSSSSASVLEAVPLSQSRCNQATQSEATVAETFAGVVHSTDDKHEPLLKGEATQSSLSRAKRESTSDTASPAAVAKDEHGNCTDVSLVTVGSRVAVYWDGEEEYFVGTVTKERPDRKKRFFVKYDDGDRQWENLSRLPFRLLGKKNKRKKKPTKPSESSPDSTEKQQTGPLNAKIEPSISGKDNRSLPIAAVNQVGKKTKREKAETNAVATVPSRSNTVAMRKSKVVHRAAETDWVSAGFENPSDDSSDSETDEEEVRQFACKMFGIQPPRPDIACKKVPAQQESAVKASAANVCDIPSEFLNVHIPISEAVKLGRRRKSAQQALDAVLSTKPVAVREPCPIAKAIEIECLVDDAMVNASAAAKDQSISPTHLQKRRKVADKPLTAEEIRVILGEDKDMEPSGHWVRRSVRQPCKSALNAPYVRALLDKLRSNDTDMVVLKLKKYLNDPNTPQIVMDATLDALEENTNCEALYIQVCKQTSDRGRRLES